MLPTQCLAAGTLKAALAPSLKVLDFQYGYMMIADFMRDEARSMPVHPTPSDVTALRVWHCKYKSLESLSTFTNLKTLVIATYPDADLTPLHSLSQLEYLRVMHMPKVSDLGPLGQLQKLKTIRLSTLPSWDSSGKKTIVHSLAPLTGLPHLAHLELFGVLPEDGKLNVLENCQSLESIRVSKYRKSEIERIYQLTEVTNSFAPPPGVDAWS